MMAHSGYGAGFESCTLPGRQYRHTELHVIILTEVTLPQKNRLARLGTFKWTCALQAHAYILPLIFFVG
jgi:hypothetical protein